ncbi:hypothetical protein SULI_05705 [Saccharolobus solfataricus]|uniref:Uncharacterized protein n=2 Tax=Saccharolobus solfataricus TaxID=2287 RepID=A0A0E3K7H5_SACSO|nr:hypothetical protein [Saccharolobus solfataricus]AKA73474.1 hypothetical protein SULB_1157 [Saccharolobus solfataricus]AKA76172.1 hypothetical protein SULC_1155 [Saccharolobus solfataricus]AKA78864.1 hypothetical protein SULA_1156 [Saccharolobus solfataricus]AZF67941.1 hypothetical protein SULG_05705 [Saccharolobus solfataricus]AZF70561.1 hypothetical protein SULH_05705 [Saccharolobus solfataricus]
MIDDKTLVEIADCLVKYRHVENISSLSVECRRVVCFVLLRVYAEDPYEDVSDDVEYCKKLIEEKMRED